MKKYMSLLLVLMILCMPITSFASENPLENTINKVIDLGANGVNMIVDKGADVVKSATNYARMSLTDIIKSFKDISTHWAKNFIAQLVKDGVVSGYPDGTFKPNANIKVSEFTVLVLKANNIEIEKAEGVWYQGVVNTAIHQEIIKQGEFDNYDRYINRGEMTQMIIRALGENPSTGNTHFADDSQIPSHLKGYVKKAVELGIIGGYPDNTFKPYGNATRAESTVVIQKMRDVKNGTIIPTIPQPPVVVEPPVVKDPAPIKTMPQQLYSTPVKVLGSNITSITEINNIMQEDSVQRSIMDTVLKQSKAFVPLYYSFNYKNYSNYKKDCKYYVAGYRDYKGETVTTDEMFDLEIKDMVKDQVIRETRFFTDDSLVYYNELGDHAVRGVIQFRYISHKNPPKGIEVGKWYEQDIDISWGNYLLNEGMNNWNHTDYLYARTKFLGQPREVR